MPLSNPVVYDVLETADYLLQARVGRAELLKVFRRRAISTAYYSVFQAICYIVTDALTDWTKEDEVREAVFRTPDHRPVKERLTRSVNPLLKQLGATFSKLQEKRHDADYASPDYNPTYLETLGLIQQARDAITVIERLDSERRTLLVVTLMARPRT